MSSSLSRKLILAFVLVSVLGVLLAVAIVRWLTIREFQQLILEQTQNNFISIVSEYYENTGTWQGVVPYLLSAPRDRRDPVPIAPPPNQIHSYTFALADQQGIIVIPARNFQLGRRVPEEILAQGQPLEVNGQFVGTMLATGDPPALDPREQNYLDRTQRVLLYAAIAAALIALLVGILLARSLTNPLRDLSAGIRALSRGEWGQQVPVRSEDEIGELAQTFNQMSADLARLEEQRKQMTADIAHDLRTPLTVLSGYIEAMQDGVLEPSPERMETMHTEIQGLIRLVEDLRTLSLADAGALDLQPEWVDPRNLLERAAAAFAPLSAEKDLQIQLQLHPSTVQVRVDRERFHQVLTNLVANAIRHSQPGGTITLSARPETGAVVLSVKDSGAGISAQALPHIFNRFYRSDKARDHSRGESGLGLAIARSIVEAHRGSITAYSEGEGKGSEFRVRLPL